MASVIPGWPVLWPARSINCFSAAALVVTLFMGGCLRRSRDLWRPRFINEELHGSERARNPDSDADRTEPTRFGTDELRSAHRSVRNPEDRPSLRIEVPNRPRRPLARHRHQRRGHHHSGHPCQPPALPLHLCAPPSFPSAGQRPGLPSRGGPPKSENPTTAHTAGGVAGSRDEPQVGIKGETHWGAAPDQGHSSVTRDAGYVRPMLKNGQGVFGRLPDT